MKIVTDENGDQYYQFEGRIIAPATPNISPNAAYTMEALLALRTWPNPYLPGPPGPEGDLTITAQRWLPGDPEPGSEPEHPTGRFENLDWETD